ncbi:gamma-glutamylcyclotransferase [Virgibacillus halophilus]|uniref:Gamma-glutamylcyclotransferase n=1 Tax=Tigheibacillus halophilus TaxID=361280 RepID=A0ABU5C744_9BACI|nr:gamma-glutamylcyclotransferase [Virgibacillus halophilus]
MVEGKVYEIAHDAVSYLYEREGVYAGSYRPAVVQVRLDKGRVVPALTFIVVHKEKETAPPQPLYRRNFTGRKGMLQQGVYKNARKSVHGIFKCKN